ncbi:MAG: competence protein CoiA family protein [bacterium]
MFKCIDSQDQREIIILDSEWEGDGLTGLRSKGRSECLLCPQCKQPVQVKAGEVKAWHFAHVDLGSCPLQSESPAILKARRLLYNWLHVRYNKLGGSRITVEKNISADMPRPVDCYVESPDGTKVAYWVFEKGMRDRDILWSGLNGVTLRAVFLASMMRPVPEEMSYDLTPTERDFAVESEYDSVYGRRGQSLHYLNHETGLFTTLRRLLIRHAPQRYSVQATLSHPLMEILTTRTGEFVHPGEHEKLLEHREEQERRSRRHEKPSSTCNGNLVTAGSQDPIIDVEPDEPDSPVIRRIKGQEPMTCERCGIQTTDWVQCRAAENTCVCRKCFGGQNAGMTSLSET